MRLPEGICLFASVCNTTANAALFSLWFARGESEYLVDLSALLNRPGDSGLTGLAWHDGTLYAAVQSAHAPRIIMLNSRLEPLGALTGPTFADLHSLHAMDGVLLAAATGTQSVLRLDLVDRTVSRLCQSTEKIHLNSACYDGESLLICFHRPTADDKRLVAGGVMDVASKHVLLHGLGLPHSLMPHGDGFLVLDSVGSRVICFDASGTKMQQELAGFLRGATRVGNSLFVASSTLRYVSRSNPTVSPARNLWELMTERVRIFELDATTLEVRAESSPVVPGFEIYELLAVPDDLIDVPAERLLQPDRNAVAHLFYDAAKRTAAATHEQPPAARPNR